MRRRLLYTAAPAAFPWLLAAAWNAYEHRPRLRPAPDRRHQP